MSKTTGHSVITLPKLDAKGHVPINIRRQVYVDAYELYRKKFQEENIGLCHTIRRVFSKLTVGHLPSYLDPINNMDIFPEIARHRPIEYGVWWWSTSNSQVRVAVLLGAIRDTLTKKQLE